MANWEDMKTNEKIDISMEEFVNEFVFLLMYTHGRGKEGPLAPLQAARCMCVPRELGFDVIPIIDL